MKVLDLLLDYLKGRTYWAAIEPFVIVAVGWGSAQLLVYQWLGASSSFKPSIELFLESYLSTRITIVSVAIAAIILVMRPFRRKDGEPTPVGRRSSGDRR